MSKIVDAVREAVTKTPSLLPQILKAAAEGAEAFAAGARLQNNKQLDLAVLAALDLPARIQDWSVENRDHRTRARIIAVGWNLTAREVSPHPNFCILEENVLDFVRRADHLYPEDAKNHYQILRGT